ncbi:MAG TPA: FAD-dependent oxidoreductase [Patescibacteria group bacterium]|nr:FAD-dependent oxidoreductase [Patescibacteria group bacterium]
MSEIGSISQPLRVAIVGAGPAGFYVAEHLFKQKKLNIEVDMYDRLPTPFGLVRAGVAPDHPKIKSVVKIFDKVASNPGFRFFGFVELGEDVTVEDLRNHYHQIVYTTGAQTDRSLNIPGIDLIGSHAATTFVAWYNGHPDFRELEFDFSQESAVVIGIGNVAVDVARILCRTTDELAKTDIADYALDALANSNIREVHMLGRRGPAQGKFTHLELKELGELEDAEPYVLPEEAKLDDLSASTLANASRGTARNVELIEQFSLPKQSDKSKKLYIRFLVSPTELVGDETGQVRALRLGHNELYATEAGTLRPRLTDRFEVIPAGLIFRSIGYRGVPVPGVPFDNNWGVILNEKGRVIDPETKSPRVGEYTAGWIKRGPTGVIGTNKPDAVETVNLMLDDLNSDSVLEPSFPGPDAVKKLIMVRQPQFFSYDDWRRVDESEISRGEALGRPRLKYTRIDEMILLKNS